MNKQQLELDIKEDSKPVDSADSVENAEMGKEESLSTVNEKQNKLLSFVRKMSNKVFKGNKGFLKIDSIYEDIKNANILLTAERRIFDIVIVFMIGSFMIIISLIILLIFLFPLKEKEPYLVTFTNDEQNFAIVQKADSSITANEALTRQLIGAYILRRESINRIDDQENNEYLRQQSKNDVWKIYERIVSNENSIYTNSRLTREVKIINLSIIKKGYANIDVLISLKSIGKLSSEKRYRIIMSYVFEPIEIDFKSLPKNPTGFIVTGYSITEIATIKELPEENKVNAEKTKSRIKYKSKEEQKDILKDLDSNQDGNEAYKFKDKNDEKSKDKNSVKSMETNKTELKKTKEEIESF